jgi:hypothetical protein
MPENTPSVLAIRHDSVWGYYANTAPAQTDAIKALFEADDDMLFLNHPAAARLHVQGLDFIVFPPTRLSEIRKTLARAKGKIAPAPSLAEAPAPPWPPAGLSLLKLEDPGKDPLETPPDYYQKLGITAADIPELTRLFQDEALRLNENNEASRALALRRHAQRALYELRAPRLARLLLEDYLAAGEDACLFAIPTESMQLLPMLGAEAYMVALAMLEEHRDAPDFCQDLLSLLADIVQKSAPGHRAHCIDILTRRLRDHPVNERHHNAFLAAILCDLKAVEAAPLIEQAYAADHIDVSYYGDWESAQIGLGLKTKRDTPEWVEREAIRKERSLAPPLFMGAGAAKPKPPMNDNDFTFAPPQPPRVNPAPKVGRNDPCPCGSGKKYKKCCMDKKP